MNRRVLAALAVFALLAAAPATAEESPIPAELRLRLFVEILSFDRALEAELGPEVVIGVLVQRRHRASLEAARELVEVLDDRPLSLFGRPVRAVEIELDLETGNGIARRLVAAGADALVVTPLRAVSVASVVTASRPLRVRTLSADPDAVAAGVAVGLGLRENRPEILVNRTAAAAEGADFDSRLLAVARMVP